MQTCEIHQGRIDMKIDMKISLPDRHVLLVRLEYGNMGLSFDRYC